MNRTSLIFLLQGEWVKGLKTHSLNPLLKIQTKRVVHTVTAFLTWNSYSTFSTDQCFSTLSKMTVRFGKGWDIDRNVWKLSVFWKGTKHDDSQRRLRGDTKRKGTPLTTLAHTVGAQSIPKVAQRNNRGNMGETEASFCCTHENTDASYDNTHNLLHYSILSHQRLTALPHWSRYPTLTSS